MYIPIVKVVIEPEIIIIPIVAKVQIKRSVDCPMMSCDKRKTVQTIRFTPNENSNDVLKVDLYLRMFVPFLFPNVHRASGNER